MTLPPASDASPRRAWLLPLVVALAALWPLVHNWAAFHQLFYFEDEWDLIDLWNQVGFSAWCTRVFAENFVPLFKLLWGGAIVVSGGSYFALLAALWLTHALNVFLLVRLARRLDADAASAAFAGLVFGLTAINLETLAWSVQWSAVLSISFFLLGALAVAEWSARERAPDLRAAALLALCTLASALCFSRGVVTGFALAAWPLFAPAPLLTWPRRLALALVPILPAVLVAAWIASHASGNQLHPADALHSMFLWGLHHYAQSPLRLLFMSQPPPLSGLVALAAAKTALYVIGFLLAPRRLRAPLLALFAFEIGNVLLLSFGRYHTGLGTAPSWRYQYAPLLALLPFVAIVLTRLSAFLFPSRALRFAFATTLAVVAGWAAQRPWREMLRDWVPVHGGETRAVLFGEPPAAEPENLSGLPWMPNQRAHLLVRTYHLH